MDTNDDNSQPTAQRRTARVFGVEISFASRMSKRAWMSLPALGVATGALMAGGIAYATVTPWIVSGSGQGDTAASTATNVTVTAGTATSNTLYPGGSGDVVLVFTNNNPFNVQVTALNLPTGNMTAYNDAGLSDTSNPAGSCNTNGSGVAWKTTPTKTLTTPIIIAAKSGSTAGTYTLTLTGNALMSATSDTNCQGRYFGMTVSSITASYTSTAAGATSGSQS